MNKVLTTTVTAAIALGGSALPLLANTAAECSHLIGDMAAYNACLAAGTTSVPEISVSAGFAAVAALVATVALIRERMSA